MITTKYAIDQNKDLFVYQGKLNHEAFIGNKKLIENGASQIKNASDFLFLCSNDLSLSKTIKNVSVTDGTQLY